MALTMTRTRTPTALTKLALMVANVHGELAFVEGLLTGSCLGPETVGRLQARRQKLVAARDALYATVRRFDAELDPERIDAGDSWKLQFGRKGLGIKTLQARYLSSLTFWVKAEASGNSFDSFIKASAQRRFKNFLGQSMVRAPKDQVAFAQKLMSASSDGKTFHARAFRAVARCVFNRAVF